MRRVQVYLRAFPARQCFTFLIVSFALSWAVWIPVLLATPTHEQLGDLLVLGTFGPGVAAILLSYRGVRAPDSKLSSSIACFGLMLLVCWAVLMGHASLWDEHRLSLATRLVLLLPSAIPAWIVSTALSRDGGVRATMRSLLTPRPFVWHLAALSLFPAILLLGATVTSIHGGAMHAPTVAGSASLNALLATVELGYAFFFGGGVSEEPGWRGFLLPRLQDRFSPLVASLLAWFPWALWHAPLDFAGYAGPTLGAYVRNRVFMLIPVAVIITWLYNRCGGTILSAALFHSAYNVAPDFIASKKWADWIIASVAVIAVVSDKMWRKPSSAVRQVKP